MDRSGSFSPGPGAGNGRNTNGEAGPEGSAFSGSAALVENAIVSLAIAARIAGIPADPESLCRAFPSREPSAIPLILLRAAKALGLKAKRMTTSAERLDRLPQPSLLLLSDGGVLIFLRFEAAKNEAAPDASPGSCCSG